MMFGSRTEKTPQDIAAPARAKAGAQAERSGGRFCRLKISDVGPVVLASARRQASSVSLASTGGCRHVGNLTQIHDLLDRLMRQAVFAHAYAVMSEDENDAQSIKAASRMGGRI